MSATATRDTKSKKTQPPTKPGIVDLALASDTPVKKAPEKVPEPKESENEVEKSAILGIPPGTMKETGRELVELLRQIGITARGKLPTTRAGKALAGLGGAAAIGLPTGYALTRGDDETPAAEAEPYGPPLPPPPLEAVTPGGPPASTKRPEEPDLLSQLGTSLGHLGSAEMRGIGSLLGKIGLPGAESKMQEWSERPDISKYVGGGTTALGTILAAMLARKLLGGSREVEAGLRVPKMRKAAYIAGFALGAKKLAAMGVPVTPIRNVQAEIVPTRTGAKTSHRSENYDAVEKLTRPAMRYR